MNNKPNPSFMPNLYGYDPHALNAGRYNQLGYGVGSVLGSLFGNYQNPYEEASQVYSQYTPQIQATLSPYINQGTQAMQTYHTHLNNLTENPTGLQDAIASHYQASPYANYLNNRAIESSNLAAQMGGVAGSPQQQLALSQVLNQINGADLNNYVNQGMNSYNRGLGGEEYLTGLGGSASSTLANLLQQQAANQANLKANQAISSNQNEADLWGGLGSLFGSALSFL